jgi:ribonucleotide reductase beta subunit family protein with ferritin-like domain
MATVALLPSPSPQAFVEPLLDPKNARRTLYPIRYPVLYNLLRESTTCFWQAGEINLAKDIEDWEGLSENERDFICRILAFFASSDSLVNENLATRFMNEVKIPEAVALYGFQIGVEVMHSEMYSILLDFYVHDPEAKARYFRAYDEDPHVRAKAEWAKRWIDSEEDFAVRLVAFVFVEGLFFSGSFAAIFWLKKRGLMEGLCQSNRLIARDEGIHTKVGYELMKLIVNKPPQELVHRIAREAVAIETPYMESSLQVDLIGMNSELMEQYIRYVADFNLVNLGYEKLFGDENPFDFIETISLEEKTLFFEHPRGTEYKLHPLNISPRREASAEGAAAPLSSMLQDYGSI